jgi:hypothetical protein
MTLSLNHGSFMAISLTEMSCTPNPARSMP